MQTATSQTLAAIRGQIAADSALLDGGPGEPATGTAPGFANLFATAAGELPATDREHYLFSLEYIFEGYLLHFGNSRLLAGGDMGFDLLAGDYMYARGLDRIARLKDDVPIRLLAGLVSLCSFVQCEEMDPVLALDAWSATTLCLAAYASGTGADCAARLMDATSDFRQGAGRLPALRQEMMDKSGAGTAARERLKREVDDIYSTFIPVFAR